MYIDIGLGAMISVTTDYFNSMEKICVKNTRQRKAICSKHFNRFKVVDPLVVVLESSTSVVD